MWSPPQKGPGGGRLRSLEDLLSLLRREGIDDRILEVMRRFPREEFLPENQRKYAYVDAPLPIGYGQTTSQPWVIARMIELLELEGNEKVLEVGTGCGYQTALLSSLAREVCSVERIPELFEMARRNIGKFKISNVKLLLGDGSRGWPEESPFDAIIVSAAACTVPKALVEQLAEGGRLVIPLGCWPAAQRIVRIRKERGKLRKEDFEPVVFVPLVGDHEGEEGKGH